MMGVENTPGMLMSWQVPCFEVWQPHIYRCRSTHSKLLKPNRTVVCGLCLQRNIGQLNVSAIALTQESAALLGTEVTCPGVGATPAVELLQPGADFMCTASVALNQPAFEAGTRVFKVNFTAATELALEAVSDSVAIIPNLVAGLSAALEACSTPSAAGAHRACCRSHFWQLVSTATDSAAS